MIIISTHWFMHNIITYHYIFQTVINNVRMNNHEWKKISSKVVRLHEKKNSQHLKTFDRNTKLWHYTSTLLRLLIYIMHTKNRHLHKTFQNIYFVNYDRYSPIGVYCIFGRLHLSPRKCSPYLKLFLFLDIMGC